MATNERRRENQVVRDLDARGLENIRAQAQVAEGEVEERVEGANGEEGIDSSFRPHSEDLLTTWSSGADVV
jgi:hypothetical protein